VPPAALILFHVRRTSKVFSAEQLQAARYTLAPPRPRPRAAAARLPRWPFAKPFPLRGVERAACSHQLRTGPSQCGSTCSAAQGVRTRRCQRRVLQMQLAARPRLRAADRWGSPDNRRIAQERKSSLCPRAHRLAHLVTRKSRRTTKSNGCVEEAAISSWWRDNR